MIILRVILYNTISECVVDWKAECGQLNLAHVIKNEILLYKEKLGQATTKFSPSPRSVKAVQMEPQVKIFHLCT